MACRSTRTSKASLLVGQEAAHSTRRIVHVRGDQAGRAIMAALVAAVRKTPSIRVLEGYVAEDLIKDGARVTGVSARGADGRLVNIAGARRRARVRRRRAISSPSPPTRAKRAGTASPSRRARAR